MDRNPRHLDLSGLWAALELQSSRALRCGSSQGPGIQEVIINNIYNIITKVDMLYTLQSTIYLLLKNPQKEIRKQTLKKVEISFG